MLLLLDLYAESSLTSSAHPQQQQQKEKDNNNKYKVRYNFERASNRQSAINQSMMQLVATLLLEIIF